MKTFAKAVCYLLLILLVAVIIGFIYKFTNGFNEDIKTFYIEYSGKYSKHIQILTTENKMTFEKEILHRFDVKYVFDKEDEKPKGYKVKIVPNVTRDFDYTVDDERYLFSKLGDLTDVFAPAKHDSYFELSIGGDMTFEDVLKRAHNGNSISVPQDAFTNNPYPFRLQISSYNGKITYNIDFTFDGEAMSSSGKTEEDSDQSTPDRDVTLYSISYDSLGRAGMEVVNFNCQDKAEAEEAVTFTASIKPEYVNQYRISGIDVYYGSGEEYIGNLTPDGDTYSFVMPDAATMEKEENEGYVYLLFYIMFVDE